MTPVASVTVSAAGQPEAASLTYLAITNTLFVFPFYFFSRTAKDKAKKAEKAYLTSFSYAQKKTEGILIEK